MGWFRGGGGDGGEVWMIVWWGFKGVKKIISLNFLIIITMGT